jgi:hypothetical protein
LVDHVEASSDLFGVPGRQLPDVLAELNIFALLLETQRPAPGPSRTPSARARARGGAPPADRWAALFGEIDAALSHR